MEQQTAEETFKEAFNTSHCHIDYDTAGLITIKQSMIKFAKIHVEAALKAADEKAEITPIDHEEISEGIFRPIYGVDTNSILNSYDLNKII